MCKSFPGELTNFSLTRIHSHIWKKVAVEKGYTLQIYPWQTSCFSLLAMISQGWSSKGFLLKHWVSNIKKKWENWKPSDDHPSPILWLQKNIDGTTTKVISFHLFSFKIHRKSCIPTANPFSSPTAIWVLDSPARVELYAQCNWSSVL